MKMSARSRPVALRLCILLMLLPGARAVHAIPDVIAISGVLEDADGAAVDSPPEGFLARIEFFASATSTQVVDSVTTRTVVNSGVFSIRHRPSDSLLALDAVFYTLAIDNENNGLDPSDEFPERFEITSAPFALSGAPADFFAIGGGFSPSGAFTASSTTFPFSDMFVYPFISPAGGVRFETMSAWMFVFSQDPAAQVSFGLYDENGDRVATTGRFVVDGSSGPLKEISVSGRLHPSRLFYAAWARDIGRPSIKRANIPGVRNTGIVPGVVTNGEIPPSFDPSTIVFSIEAPLSITLSR